MKLFSIMIILSLLMILINHPISLGFGLIIFSLLTSWQMMYFNSTLWINYNLYLVMIGGILILFLYMTSISSNMKFNFKFYILFMMMMIFMFLSMILSMKSNYLLTIFNNNNNFMNLSIQINWMFFFISYFFMIYLFFMLFIIMNIIDYKIGPLRKI